MGGYMDGYSIAHLEELLNEIGEERVKSILSNFSCPRNRDIEFFLRDKAIEFSKQSIAKTYLVFTSYKQEAVLAGYFTVANKQMQVSKDDLSKNIIRKIARFGTENNGIYTLTAPLIAQLGNNFSNDYNKLITGEELLGFAIQKIQMAQYLLGGKICYVECENQQKLISFYESAGFIRFGRRNIDEDELNSGRYLIQLLRIDNTKYHNNPRLA